jgi:uncharacterized protein (DUF1684 family)
LPEHRGEFSGLDYWPTDSRYRMIGPVHVYPEPQEFEIPTTSGKVRTCERYGWIEFELDGQVHSLQVYRLDPDVPDRPFKLFLPFTDGTSGEQTYPAGRYLDLDGAAGGLYELDFNRAYNPSCAYGDPSRYVCPVTPPENRLSVRIEAGERGYVEPVAQPS